MSRVAIVLGVLSLAAGAGMWWQDQPRDVGTVDLAPPSAATAAADVDVDSQPPDATRDRVAPSAFMPKPESPPAARTRSASPERAGATATPGERQRSPAASRPRIIRLDLAQPAPAPIVLRAPGLGLTVALDEVGLDDDGQMAIPADVRRAGWYRWGPAPGAPGNAVLAGHVDSRTQGLGAFAQIEELVLGDVVTTTADDGATTRWEIIGRQRIDKEEIDPSSLFRREGPPRLVLVTCGGAFDDRARSYSANVVVVARPLR